MAQVLQQSAMLSCNPADETREKTKVNEVHQGFRTSALFQHTMKDIYNALEYKLTNLKYKQQNAVSQISQQFSSISLVSADTKDEKLEKDIRGEVTKKQYYA